MVKTRVSIAHPKEKKVLMNLRIPLQVLSSCNKYAERHAWETEMSAHQIPRDDLMSELLVFKKVGN